MPTNTLTDAQCRGAKPAEKPQKLFDGGGLHLFVSTTGVKTWRVAYRLAGVPQTKSLGPYPEVSLAKAREGRDKLKEQLREGADPMAERKVKRSGQTFSEAIAAYWGGRKDLSKSYRESAERGLELHLVPKLGARPVGSITREDLLGELNRMDAAGLHVFVRKVRMWAGQVFDQAVEHGHAKINPAALIKPEKAFGRKKVKNFASVSPADLPGLLQRLALEREIQSVLACQLLALTWVRTTELRMMTWSELEGDLWRIPEERMKRGVEHLVPLSQQALAVIEKMRARSRGSDYVFPSDHRLDRPMSENAVLYLLHRIGYKDRMTGHGWRSVASTWANESGYPPDAIERQLAHMPNDETRAAYNKASYLPQRREMLQRWVDYLDCWNRTVELRSKFRE